MSEFIEKRRELSIHEYEFMKHLKLFTDDEIRGVKNKRFQHEHKVERREKQLVDFINYIVYENNLLELLEERRKKLRVREGKHSLESSIQNRIKMLYKRAMDRFPSEYRLWVHYLKHCEKYGFTSEGSRMLDKMLNYHGDKTKAWIGAANWEYQQMDNMDRAKHFMFRGLQRHPNCRELYLSFLELQLKEAEKIAEKAEETVEQLMAQEDSLLHRTLECINLIYEHYKKRDQDLDFFVQLLCILKDLKVVKSFGAKVLEDMKTMFATNELMWHTLAQLALDGSYLLDDEDNSEEPIKMTASTLDMAKRDANFGEHLQRCIQVYEAAVEVLASNQMWTYYIDSMLELNEDMASHQKLRRKALGNSFKKAYEIGFLGEDKFVQYLKLLINTDNPEDSFVTEVMKKAIETYPHSCKLWELHLTYLVRKDATVEEIDTNFKQSLKQCTENVLPLWMLLFQYYHVRSDLPDKTEQTFREAIKQPTTVSAFFQPRFLDFLVITKNINAARKEYREMQRSCPSCLELHRKMAHLESIQAQPDLDQWRMCYENATQYFGTTNTDLWIDYIKFERDNGSPKNIQYLFERAKTRLDVEMVGNFINDYELFKNPLI